MHYVRIIIESNGKLLTAKAFDPDDDNHNYNSVAGFCRHIGYDVPKTATVYKGGEYSGCSGRALVVLGPYADVHTAEAVACTVQLAANAADTATFLLENT